MTTTIIDFLKGKDLDANLPGIKVGDCLSPYIVVRKAELQPFNQFSTVQELYDIMCYVPQNKLSTLSTYFSNMKAEMKLLEATLMIRPAHSETADYFDPGVKAWMRSAQYILYHRK